MKKPKERKMPIVPENPKYPDHPTENLWTGKSSRYTRELRDVLAGMREKPKKDYSKKSLLTHYLLPAFGAAVLVAGVYHGCLKQVGDQFSPPSEPCTIEAPPGFAAERALRHEGLEGVVLRRELRDLCRFHQHRYDPVAGRSFANPDCEFELHQIVFGADYDGDGMFAGQQCRDR